MEVAENRLCVLCCFSSPSIDKPDRVDNCLSDESSFKIFLNYLDQLNNNDRSNCNQDAVFDKKRLLKLIGDCGDKVTLCGHCSKLISKAVEVRREVGVVEENVIRMQRELLKELRRLKELMASYYRGMRAIEETVMGSDLECLENFLEGIMGRSWRRRQDAEFVLFREKISQVVEDLGAYRRDLDERHGLEEVEEPHITLVGLEATSDSGDVESEIKEGRRRPVRSKAANVNSFLVRESEEDDSSDETESLADISSDYEPDFHSEGPAESSLRVASMVVSKKKKRVVIESSSSEEEIEEEESSQEEPCSGPGEEESDFEPPSPPVKRHRRSDDPSKEDKPQPTLNIPPVKFFGMSKLKKAVIKSIIQRKKLQFRKYGTPSSTNSLDLPVSIRVPFDYDSANKLTIGGLEVIVDQGHLKCTVCDFQSPSFGSKSLKFVMDKIYNHVADKHLNAFQCHLCPKSFHARKAFRNHLTDHKKINACNCDICGKPLSDPRSVAEHKWTHLSHNEQSRALKNDKAPAVIKRRLKSKNNSEDKAYQCDTCGKRFGSAQDLKRHVTRVHSGDSNDDVVICPKCGKECKRQSYHVYHKKYVCPLVEEERSRLPCMECDKTFKSDKGLKNHVARIHSKEAVERPFICDLCGKGYKAEYDLKLHQRTHSKDRPWKCDKCGKDFNMKRNLARHKCCQDKSH